MDTLKEKDRDVLFVIEDTFATTGFAPSIAEVAAKLDMSKGSVLADCFKRLEAAGMVTFHPTRKYYIPSRWHELIMAESMEQVEKKVMDRIRQQTNDRVKRFRERNGGNKKRGD